MGGGVEFGEAESTTNRNVIVATTVFTLANIPL